MKNFANGWFDEYVGKYMPEGTDKETAKVRLIDLLDFVVREKLNSISPLLNGNEEIKAYLDQVKQISFARIISNPKTIPALRSTSTAGWKTTTCLNLSKP